MNTLAGAAIGGARATIRHTEANAPMVQRDAGCDRRDGGVAVFGVWGLHDRRVGAGGRRVSRAGDAAVRGVVKG